jgi:RNA polymerase subunit RPABC4/transcription elongation factor Spt4
VTASVFGGMHDFFNSTTWVVVRGGAIVFVALFWIATVFWVRKDARRRIANRQLVWLATLIGAIPPFLGPLIYMLFRPPEYLEDVRERELELKMIERGLEGRELTCWVCNARVEAEFLVCPVCTTRLRQACTGCNRPLEPAWQVCPYCETPVVADENTVPLRPQAKRRPRQTRSSGS